MIEKFGTSTLSLRENDFRSLLTRVDRRPRRRLARLQKGVLALFIWPYYLGVAFAPMLGG